MQNVIYGLLQNNTNNLNNPQCWKDTNELIRTFGYFNYSTLHLCGN